VTNWLTGFSSKPLGIGLWLLAFGLGFGVWLEPLPFGVFSFGGGLLYSVHHKKNTHEKF
jgi:hypothetical protein